MSIHFLSFLGDVIVWLYIGAYLGLLINSKEQVKNTRTIFATSLVALSIGLFSTINYSLPDQGIAWIQLIVVFASVATFSLITYKGFRSFVFDELYKIQLLLSSSHLFQKR